LIGVTIATVKLESPIAIKLEEKACAGGGEPADAVQQGPAALVTQLSVTVSSRWVCGE
jgi:hypothetical protein